MKRSHSYVASISLMFTLGNMFQNFLLALIVINSISIGIQGGNMTKQNSYELDSVQAHCYMFCD